jgi:hypothetical protein
MSDEPTRLLTTQAITKEALRVLNEELERVPRYYKIRQLDGTYCICKGYVNGPIVKDKLSEAEANTYLRLLKEQ